MSHRRRAALGVALLLLTPVACGDEGSGVTTAPTGAPASTATSPSTAPTGPGGTSTAPTTGPPSTTPRPTSPPVTAPPATAPPVTVTPGRTAALGESFSLGVGETVSIPAEGLSVTFGNVGSDNRCPPGVQCIVAGNASIGVPVVKAGSAGAILVLNTTEGPTTASYGPYTVELVRLGFSSPPIATLRVT